MICTACGRSWVGQHHCGETVAEAEANARIAKLETENERLQAVVVDAYKRTEHMEALFHGK